MFPLCTPGDGLVTRNIYNYTEQGRAETFQPEGAVQKRTTSFF